MGSFTDLCPVFELTFVPLWDAGSSRWFSGCFCWRTFVNRSISIEMELQFIVAFSHSIMGEVCLAGALTQPYIMADHWSNRSHDLLHCTKAGRKETSLVAYRTNFGPRCMGYSRAPSFCPRQTLMLFKVTWSIRYPAVAAHFSTPSNTYSTLVRLTPSSATGVMHENQKPVVVLRTVRQ